MTVPILINLGGTADGGFTPPVQLGPDSADPTFSETLGLALASVPVGARPIAEPPGPAIELVLDGEWLLDDAPAAADEGAGGAPEPMLPQYQPPNNLVPTGSTVSRPSMIRSADLLSPELVTPDRGLSGKVAPDSSGADSSRPGRSAVRWGTTRPAAALLDSDMVPLSKSLDDWLQRLSRPSTPQPMDNPSAPSEPRPHPTPPGLVLDSAAELILGGRVETDSALGQGLGIPAAWNQAAADLDLPPDISIPVAPTAPARTPTDRPRTERADPEHLDQSAAASLGATTVWTGRIPPDLVRPAGLAAAARPAGLPGLTRPAVLPDLAWEAELADPARPVRPPDVPRSPWPYGGTPIAPRPSVEVSPRATTAAATLPTGGGLGETPDPTLDDSSRAPLPNGGHPIVSALPPARVLTEPAFRPELALAFLAEDRLNPEPPQGRRVGPPAVVEIGGFAFPIEPADLEAADRPRPRVQEPPSLTSQSQPADRDYDARDPGRRDEGGSGAADDRVSRKETERLPVAPLVVGSGIIPDSFEEDPPRVTGLRPTGIPEAADPIARRVDHLMLDLTDELGDLGRLRVSVSGQSVRATILPHDPALADRLNGEMRQLRTSLAERGFSDPQITVVSAKPEVDSARMVGRELAVGATVPEPKAGSRDPAQGDRKDPPREHPADRQPDERPSRRSRDHRRERHGGQQ